MLRVAVFAMNPRRQRKLWATVFAMVVSVALLAGVYAGLYAVGGIDSLNQSFYIPAGSYRAVEVSGTSWSTMQISLTSSSPVTFCITDAQGMEMLREGKGALCFFRASHVTSINRMWRFPTSGELYLVVIPEDNANVKIKVKTGLILP